jgi:hypothetical protein
MFQGTSTMNQLDKIMEVRPLASAALCSPCAHVRSRLSSARGQRNPL